LYYEGHFSHLITLREFITSCVPMDSYLKEKLEITYLSGNNTSQILDLSIIIPVYFNEGVVSITMNAIYNDVILRNPKLQCEILFVDDGSEDGSLDELLRLRQQFHDVIKIIKLTRNFGQVNAIHAGLSHAAGKAAVILSADNQDPADLINTMLAAYSDEGFDIVICTRTGRDESFIRKWTSNIFYTSIRKLSFPNMPQGGFDYVLLSRRVFKTILQNKDAAPFLQGQILWTGFKTKFIEYFRNKRTSGQSRWTFGRKITYLIDGVLGYSFFPIRIISITGLFVAFLGFLYATAILIIKLTWGLPVVGWAPIMIVLLVIGGLQMSMLGIIGEYLWRVLAQVRNRTPYIIEEIYEKINIDPGEEDNKE